MALHIRCGRYRCWEVNCAHYTYVYMEPTTENKVGSHTLTCIECKAAKTYTEVPSDPVVVCSEKSHRVFHSTEPVLCGTLAKFYGYCPTSKCDHCHGKGSFSCITYITCPACSGRGGITCTKCYGKSYTLNPMPDGTCLMAVCGACDNGFTDICKGCEGARASRQEGKDRVSCTFCTDDAVL